MNQKGKRLAGTVLAHIADLAACYALLSLLLSNHWMVTSTGEITGENFMVQLLLHSTVMLAAPLLIILACRTGPRELGVTADSRPLCAVLAAVYGAFFLIAGDYSAAGCYRAVYLLFSVSLGEELFFRGWSYRRLKQVHIGAAVAVSGAFWGAGHAVYPGILAGKSISEILLSMVVGGSAGMNVFGGIASGVLFIALLEWSGTLLVPILVHALLDYSPSLGELSWLGPAVSAAVFLWLAVRRACLEKRPLAFWREGADR